PRPPCRPDWRPGGAAARASGRPSWSRRRTRSWRRPASRTGTGSFRDHDPRRAQHEVAQPVALLQDLDDGARLRAVDGLREQRLVDVRVERAVGLDLPQAGAGEHVRERTVDEPDAVLELRLLVLLRRDQRPLEVVEHGQELLDERLARACGPGGALARGPLAEVVELGFQPPERVEVLVALAPKLRRGVSPLLVLRHRLGLGAFALRHEVGASSSTTSASSITSSSEGSAPLPAPDDAAWAAVAWA